MMVVDENRIQSSPSSPSRRWSAARFMRMTSVEELDSSLTLLTNCYSPKKFKPTSSILTSSQYANLKSDCFSPPSSVLCSSLNSPDFKNLLLSPTLSVDIYNNFNNQSLSFFDKNNNSSNNHKNNDNIRNNNYNNNDEYKLNQSNGSALVIATDAQYTALPISSFPR